MQEKCLGAIRVEGGSVLVTDPCYLPDDAEGWVERGEHAGEALMALVEGIAPGAHPVWIVVDDRHGWGMRVETLRLEVERGVHGRRERAGEVGVDSGQMSMLSPEAAARWGGSPDTPADMDSFEEQCKARRGELNYLGVCDLTLASFGGTIGSDMAASSSGLGDGVYPVYVDRGRDGRVLSVTVEFMEDGDDGDE